MTRAKDISKIVTDADLSGTLDVTGTVTAGGLDIQGDGTISGGSRLTISDIADENNDGIRLDDSTTARFNNLTQDSSGNFKIQHWTGSAWQNNFTLTTGGNVGIGTTSPNSRLTSASTDGSTGLSIHRTFSGNVSGETTVGGLDFTLTDTATSNQVVSRISPVGSAGTGDAFAGAMRFYTAGNDGNIAERMRINSSGNMGLGVVPNSSWHSTLTALQIGGNASLSAQSAVGASKQAYFSQNVFNDGDQKYISTDQASNYYQGDGKHVFQVAASGSANAVISWNTALTVDNSGNVLVGTNSNTLNSLHFVHSSGGQHAMGSRVGTNGNFALGVLNSSGTVVGGVVANTSSTAYNTSSDHRLKENVIADWEATTRLKQLNPVRFNFIADADTTVDGFLAHEVQSVVPEAISGTHNEVDADGNPVYQGIDQAKLVPLLVKTIQELEARIVALETA